MRLISWLRKRRTKSLAQRIDERDHELNECAETHQVKPGMYSVERCDVCHAQNYSLKDYETNDKRHKLLSYLRDED